MAEGIQSAVSGDNPLAAALNPNGSYPIRVGVLREIARTLDEAHSLGQVHGDFYPGKVDLTGQPETGAFSVHINGFGNPPAVDGDLLDGRELPSSAYYFSPERILGVELTPRSDQFSFAVLAYEATFGAYPFPASDAAVLFRKICNEEPVQPVQPGQLAEVLNRGLAKQPQRRYANCRALVEELARALQSVPPTAFVLRRADVASESPVVVERQRKRLDLDDKARPARSRMRFGKPLLFAGLLAGLVLLFLYGTQHPPHSNLPQQTLDTHSAPMVPAPSNPQPEPPPAPAQTKPPIESAPPVQRPQPVTPRTPAVSSTAEVQFRGEPNGLRAVIDNSLSQSCQIPCSMPLQSGRHTFVAMLDGYREQKGILHVPEDRSVSIRLSREAGTLIITSSPAGATITIDGRSYGQTPANTQLAPGEHQVIVMSNGRQQRATLKVIPDSILSKTFTFE